MNDEKLESIHRRCIALKKEMNSIYREVKELIEQSSIKDSSMYTTALFTPVARFISDIEDLDYYKKEAIDKYGQNRDLIDVGIIPVSYLTTRLRQLKQFKRFGSNAGNGVLWAIDQMVKSGDLVEVRITDLIRRFNTKARCVTSFSNASKNIELEDMDFTMSGILK